MSVGDRVSQGLANTSVVFSDVALAAEFGGTHVAVSGTPFRYDAFLPDNTDPYPAWSQNAISLFRVFPPPALQPWIPADTVRDNRAHLDAQFAELRRHGLRAVVSGHEPLWLPEGVYRAHPRWRGGQCELGRIAAKPYFTPSIDEPEVLDLYRWAAREWCRAYPETDIFNFWSNDCGAGIPWSVYAYPGPNGPLKYRRRDPGERVAGWLEAIRAGAAEADCDVRVHIHSFSFPPTDTAAIRARLGARLYLNNFNGAGEPLGGASAACAADQAASPVAGLCHPLAFVKGLEAVFNAGAGGPRSIGYGADTRDVARLILQTYLEEPGKGVAHRAKIAEHAAGRLAGADRAGDLIEIWEQVEQACHAVRQIRQRGLGLAIVFALTTARWLIRPLVPQPLLLTDEETAHYRHQLLSVGTPEQNANLCYVLGKPVFHGDGVVWMTRWCLQEAIDALKSARSRLAAILGALPDGANRQMLVLYEARLGAFACLLENARLTVLYQHAVSIADQPRFGVNPLDFDDNILYDQRTLEMRKLARADLDNTMELIDLLEAHPRGALICQAATPELENVFTFGPDLAGALRRKMEITLNHWHDYERLYPTSKVHEFEPREVER